MAFTSSRDPSSRSWYAGEELILTLTLHICLEERQILCRSFHIGHLAKIVCETKAMSLESVVVYLSQKCFCAFVI